jgi:hypothetical protein
MDKAVMAMGRSHIVPSNGADNREKLGGDLSGMAAAPFTRQRVMMELPRPLPSPMEAPSICRRRHGLYAVRLSYFFFAFRRRRRRVLRTGFAALALRRLFLLFAVIGIERLPLSIWAMRIASPNTLVNMGDNKLMTQA